MSSNLLNELLSLIKKWNKFAETHNTSLKAMEAILNKIVLMNELLNVPPFKKPDLQDVLRFTLARYESVAFQAFEEVEEFKEKEIPGIFKIFAKMDSERSADLLGKKTTSRTDEDWQELEGVAGALAAVSEKLGELKFPALPIKMSTKVVSELFKGCRLRTLDIGEDES